MNGPLFFYCLLASLAVCLSQVRGNPNDDTLNKEDRDNEEERASLKYVITSEVYLDVAIKESKEGATEKTGRIVIGLFGDITPMTSTNFAQIAKGFKRDGVREKNIQP